MRYVGNGDDEIRTRNFRLDRAALWPLSYTPKREQQLIVAPGRITVYVHQILLSVERLGVEPRLLGLQGRCFPVKLAPLVQIE
jgi:hypothetical protein